MQDMLEAIIEVIDATPPSREGFDRNKYLQSHLLRHIQIIGEAAWRTSSRVKEQWPQVPWKEIAGMRHILVHNYFEVNWGRVYETARDHVPALKAHVEMILSASPADPL